MNRSIKILSSVITLALVAGSFAAMSPTKAFAANSTVSSNVDSDGTVHGNQIGTDRDGKAIYSQPSLTSETKKLINAKTSMAKAHENYKNGKIKKN